jgi:hypothetical protein
MANQATHHDRQGLQTATQHTVFTLLYLSTNVWITTFKNILFYLYGCLRMTYRKTHLDPRERKYKEEGQNNTRTNSVMISAVHSFRVTNPRRMIQMGGARSTRETDKKCTDYEGEKPTKTNLKEYRACSWQCLNQVQDGTVMGNTKGTLSDCQLLQKDHAVQSWPFS